MAIADATEPMSKPNGYHQNTKQDQMPKHIEAVAMARRVVCVIGVVF